ncbi:MAG: Ig-like domain-containing protein, partial [Acidimicrobiia bacterium]
LEFTDVITIPILSGIVDPDGDPITITLNQAGNGVVWMSGGDVIYDPIEGFNGTDSFLYTATDGRGGSSSGLVTIRVTQLDGALISVDFVTAEPVPAIGPEGGGSSFFVDNMRLLIGSVTETAGLLGLPLLAVAAAFAVSTFLGLGRNFLIGRGPVFLPLQDPAVYGVVFIPEDHFLTALDGPGEEHPMVYRFGAAETGIRSTGRSAQRGAALWLEVETPDGDAWVEGRFLTRMISPGRFADDPQLNEWAFRMNQTVAERGNLDQLVSDRGLHVSYYAPPKHFSGDELQELLVDGASWGWWDPNSSSPSVRGSFRAMVADPLRESMTTLTARPGAEAVADVPLELVNFSNLTYAEYGALGWRLFFEYDDQDRPHLVAIWREGAVNQAAV